MRKTLWFSLAWLALLAGSMAGSAQQNRPAGPPPPPPPADDYFPKRWKEFSPPEGGFKVLLPGAPKPSAQTDHWRSGDVVTHTFGYQGVIAYDLKYTDYPRDVEGPAVVEKMFDLARDDGLEKGASWNPRIIKEEAFTLSSHPGRFLQVELSGGTVLRIKFIAVKERLYTLVATSGKARRGVLGSENDYEEIAKTFLDSFQLTKP